MEQYRRASLIYNPVARGLARHRHLLQRSIATLGAGGIIATLVPTEAAGSAGKQARAEIERGADLIIAAGGDGTINEVASGMLHTAVPLAILPGGTANVLAREMRVPINIDRVAAQIPTYIRHAVSVGRVTLPGSEPRSFLCMTGVGLDAEIVSRVNNNLKVKTGKFAYYISGFSNFLADLPEFDVTVDGKKFRSTFALISRVRNYGGDLEIARNASLLRNDFEVVLFEGRARLRYLPYLLAVAFKQAHRMSGCTVLRAHHVACTVSGASRVYVQVDGELLGHAPAVLDIAPQALTMLLPKDYVAREQRYVKAEAVCA